MECWMMINEELSALPSSTSLSSPLPSLVDSMKHCRCRVVSGSVGSLPGLHDYSSLKQWKYMIIYPRVATE